MIKVLKSTYWSKSEAFLLPLSGLPKTLKYSVKSYLFWDEYSIDNYELILHWEYDDCEEFFSYCREEIFPILSKKSYLTEIFDGDKSSIFILNISEWALDIEMFIKGKYSKMSDDAKMVIEDYHKYYDTKVKKIPPEISAAIEPTTKFEVYGNRSAIEYVAENYGLDLNELTKLGELANPYDKTSETLENFNIKVA